MAGPTVKLQVDYVTEPVDGECPTCGFDAMRRVRAYFLGSTGVTMIGCRTYCGRCRSEERREEGANGGDVR